MVDLKINLRELLGTIKISQNDIELLHFNIANMWKFFTNCYDTRAKYEIGIRLKKSIEMVKYLKEEKDIKNHMLKTYLLKLVLSCLTAELYKDENKNTYEMKASEFIKDVIRLKRIGYKSIRTDADYLKYNRALNKVLNAVGYNSNNTTASIGWLSSLSVVNLQEVSSMVLEHREENKEIFTTPLSLFFNMVNRELLNKRRVEKYIKDNGIKVTKKLISDYKRDVLKPYLKLAFTGNVYFAEIDREFYRGYYGYMGYAVSELKVNSKNTNYKRNNIRPSSHA